MMLPLDIAIVMLKTVHQVAQHSPSVARQVLTNLAHDHPHLPWKIAFDGLQDSVGGYAWARCVLVALGLV